MNCWRVFCRSFSESRGMQSIISNIFAAAFGFVLVHFLTRAPELRPLRLVQSIFVPLLFMAAVSLLPDPATSPGGIAAVGQVIMFAAVIVLIGVIIAPNIGHICGSGLMDFLENADWTPLEEEIALRPIRQLIDKDQFQEAHDELEEILKTHKATYEALHLRAKLQNFFQHYDEARAALLQMLPLSNTPDQQWVVFELLATLEEHDKAPSDTAEPGARPIRITHELVLLDATGKEPTARKTIPPGEYEIEEILQGRRRWLLLKGQTWGNAGSCWEAMQKPAEPPPPKKGFFYQVVRVQDMFTHALKRRRRVDVVSDSRVLLKEANQCIREGNWAAALPLLQKAAAKDPDYYEIAYRLVQTAFQLGPPRRAADLLNDVLGQSRWTDNEERMLKQLKR